MNQFDGWHSLKDQIPRMGTCVLVFDSHSLCVFAAYIEQDGDFYQWTPGEKDYGSEVKIEFEVDQWCYPPYPEGIDNLIKELAEQGIY